MAQIEERLEKLNEAIILLSEQAKKMKEYRKIAEETAKWLVGKPYYWGEFSGHFIASSDTTKVIAHIFHQKTGEECYWTFDAMTALEYWQEIRKYNSWEEYDKENKLAVAKSYEESLRKYLSEEHVVEKMIEFCSKFEIEYKNYLQ